jgi:hypothetical protein
MRVSILFFFLTVLNSLNSYANAYLDENLVGSWDEAFVSKQKEGYVKISAKIFREETSGNYKKTHIFCESFSLNPFSGCVQTVRMNPKDLNPYRDAVSRGIKILEERFNKDKDYRNHKWTKAFFTYYKAPGDYFYGDVGMEN